MILFEYSKTKNRPQPRYIQLVAPLLLAATLITGCGSNPSKKDLDTTPIVEVRDHTPLIEAAQNSESPLKEQYLLEAADILANKEKDDWARNLLASIEPDQISDALFISYTELYSTLALDDDAYFLAQRILTEPRLERQWRTLPVATALQLRERRAQVFIILGEIELSVRERLLLEPLLNDQKLRDSNQNAIWQALMTLPQAQLENGARNEANLELKAWYQLASINKNHQGDLTLQQRQIESWTRQWPEHSASVRLPSDLQLINELIRTSPKQVALLLPTSGKLAKAGKAIRDGFFSAYYQAQAEGANTAKIRIYDTGSADTLTLYQQAQLDGATFVVGPLDKDKVSELNDLDTLPIPILSLNYLEVIATPEPADSTTEDQSTEIQAVKSESARPELFQFGLAIEDEAIQTARRAWLEGHRRAMVITPDASWGERSAYAFTAEWQALGGEVLSINRFTGKGDYLNVIASALQIDQSQQRAQKLRNLFGHGFEFEPRRRQDLDMIFLIAQPEQARQIMPTLSFHYASDIPVFATSHIYSGFEDRKSDRDLNNIKFSTLPWVFDKASAEKKSITTYRKSSASYDRLYALGVDAYRLYPRLPQLQQVPGTHFYGATGALQLLRNQRIQREQVWAQIRGGRIYPLPVVVSNPI